VILLLFSTLVAFSGSVAFGKSPSYFNQKSVSTPYYKSPNSLFPSGEESEEKLFTNLRKDYAQKMAIEESYYEYNKQKISKKLIQVTVANDLSANDLSVRGLSNKDLSASQHSSALADLGYFLTLKKSMLRSTADFKSKTLATINENTLLIPRGYSKGFVFVEITTAGKKLKGYVDISDCISKFDFAKAIYAVHPKTKLKQWIHVKNRSFDFMESTDGSIIPMSYVLGLYPDHKKAIITRKDQALPQWTTLEIKTDSQSVWLASEITGHGTVYWKKNLNENRVASNTIKIDELLKKEISFVSFHSKNPRKAVASANGLYITDDGENWRLIEQFRNYSGPVLYYNDYLIYAGNYRSTDAGKTFENYIQIEKMAGVIVQSTGVTPKRLQVKKIKTIKPFKVEVDVDIGSRVLKLQTPVYAQSWQVMRL